MIRVAWPWMACLAPLPLLGYRLRRAAKPSGSGLYLPFAAPLAARDASAAVSRPSRVLFAAAWIALVLAAMRPQWLGPPQASLASGRPVILAVDVSGSMATQDMAHNETRLQVVKQIAGRFIEHRRGDRVGLILFGTHAYIQAPLTTDLGTVHRFLDRAVVGVAGPQTAIGDAIGLAIKRLLNSHAYEHDAHGAQRAVMVLLTDGGNDAGVLPPVEAARLAAQVGLKIYTIGVGAAVERGPFGFLTGNTSLNVTLLRKIAKLTGGRYFRATDAAALAAVYREINRLAPAPGHKLWLRPVDEWFAWPLALAVLLSIPAAWIGSPAWS